ncbi:MAG: hypothetical protein LH647_10235, partial [Leptolyngbyaceae cyanobacterium CAN_BIN12]|nr:hypothetical protein [Leptolyngbyaceae cyanobacterium CAN_BIN12]
MAAALEILEAKYGVVITYEDVPYMHEEEIMDQTSSEYRQSHPGGPRALIPRGGSLEITDQI